MEAADKTFKKSLSAVNLNWIGIKCLVEECKTTAKIRSIRQPTGVILIPEGDGVRVIFDELQKSVAIGQSVAFCDDIVLGGGVIDNVQ